MAVSQTKMNDIMWWQLTVFFNITFISVYIFMLIFCHRTKFQHISYDDNLGLQMEIGESMDFSALKTARSLDSVLFVLKDDPEICDALKSNTEISKNYTIETLFQHSPSQTKNKTGKSKSSYRSSFKHTFHFATNKIKDNGMTCSHTLCTSHQITHTLSTHTINSKNKVKIRSTVTLCQSTCSVTAKHKMTC